MSSENRKIIAENRKAYYDFFIIEKFEAGLVLTGTEIKSIRMGRVTMADCFARVEKGEVLLYNMHISPYVHGNRYNHDPVRTRNVLLHKQEIMKLFGKTQEKGLSLIGLKLYWSGDWAKIELGLAKGKKEYDKRDTIKQRDSNREIGRAMRKFAE
ncbi:MAG: SsrA-binding protein SmpB [Cyanobacteriota bacterium]